MKSSCITLLTLVVSLNALAQFDVDKNKYAWERTAYERWDNFKPKLYFDLFAKKYKNTDRRTMATRSVTMFLVGIQADNYKIYSRSIDSIYKIETNKAIDRTINKNYILFQRTRVNKISEDFEEIMDRALVANIPESIHTSLQERFLASLDNITFLKKSYAPDADKFPLIEKEIEKLDEQLNMLTKLTAMQESIFEIDPIKVPLLIEGLYQEIQVEIKSIIKTE